MHIGTQGLHLFRAIGFCLVCLLGPTVVDAEEIRTPGSARCDNQSIEVTLNLGQSGLMALKTERPTPDIAHPNLWALPGGGHGFGQVFNAEGNRQQLFGGQVYVRFEELVGSGDQVSKVALHAFEVPIQALANTNDFSYLLHGKILSATTTVVERLDLLGEEVGVHTVSGKGSAFHRYTWITNYQGEAGCDGWLMRTENDQGITEVWNAKYHPGGDTNLWVEWREERDGRNTLRSGKRKILKRFGHAKGDKWYPIEESVRTPWAGTTEQKAWYDDPGDPARYLKPKHVLRADGSWTRWQYNDRGWETEVVTSMNGNPLDSPAELNHVTATDYSPLDEGDVGLPFRARSVTIRKAGKAIEKTYYYFGLNAYRTIHPATPTSAWNDPANRVEIELRTLQGN